jgi:TonB family protein
MLAKVMRQLAVVTLLLVACRDSPQATSKYAKVTGQHPDVPRADHASVPSRTPHARLKDAPYAGEPFRVGGRVAAPVAIKRVEPRYPAVVGEYHLGIMMLEMVIGRDGAVHDLRVTSGPPNSAFGDAIVTAVKQWRFKPATIDGHPVAVVYNMTVNHVPLKRVER